MGHHYVSREHLRRFAIKGKENFVWMYDKQTQKFSEASIRTVAQEKAYYDPEIEVALATEIEAPGKKIIDKLLNREVIDSEERIKLSLYFMILLSRGPRQRKKSSELVPDIMDEVMKKMEVTIKQQISDEPGNPKAHLRLQELEEVREKYSNQIPQNVLDMIRIPNWSEATVECIYRMCWHIFPAPPNNLFVTGDTPAHTFEKYGLGSPLSEYTISLSKDYALIGEQRRKPGVFYEKPHAQVAKEVNRRILSHVERFVFSSMPFDWIDSVAQKKKPFISHISW